MLYQFRLAKIASGLRPLSQTSSKYCHIFWHQKRCQFWEHDLVTPLAHDCIPNISKTWNRFRFLIWGPILVPNLDTCLCSDVYFFGKRHQPGGHADREGCLHMLPMCGERLRAYVLRRACASSSGQQSAISCVTALLCTRSGSQSERLQCRTGAPSARFGGTAASRE